MLSCIYNGKDLNNKEEGYTEKQIRDLGIARQLFCPKCGRAVYFCAQGKITSHFKHFEKSCEDSQLYAHDINSERHNNATEIFYHWIKAQYPASRVIKDKYLANGNDEQKADLYLETPEAKIAFEIQFLHINFDALEARRAFYKQLGIKDIWIFVKKGVFGPGTPYERYYYRSNDRELYFFEETAERFSYYKGLKSENFLEGPLVRYIAHSCNLPEVTLDHSGRLNLPLWREKYLEKLTAIREQNHSRIRTKKQRRTLPQKSNKPDSVGVETTAVSSYPDWLKEAIRNTNYNVPRNIEVKASTQNFDFVDIRFFKHNDRDYAEVTYMNNGETKAIYEVKSHSGSGNETYLICKKPDTDYTYDLQIISSPSYKKIRIIKHSI